MFIVYISLTGNIKRFLSKIDGISSLGLNQGYPYMEVNRDYILIVPSYSNTLTERVCEFIDYKDNRKFLKGVVGSGEKNFNQYYIFSARDISKKYNVPLVFDFEKSGTNDDVEKFKKEVLKY